MQDICNFSSSNAHSFRALLKRNGGQIEILISAYDSAPNLKDELSNI